MLEINHIISEKRKKKYNNEVILVKKVSRTKRSNIPY